MCNGSGTFDYFRLFKTIPDETEYPNYTMFCIITFRLFASDK